VGYAEPTLADSVIATENGEAGSIVTVEGNRYTITGGRYSGDRSNLFHALEQLNLGPNEIADFISGVDVNNIVTLINGGNASYLDGLIQVSGGNSNLYLINPAGVLFGESAALNLPANLTVTTADRVGFGDQWLSVFEPNSYTALTGEPSSFAFTAQNPGIILNEGDLSLNAGTQLMLLGGTVINTGTLTAADGLVTVASVPGEQLVSVGQAGSLISLELAATNESAGSVPEGAMPFDPLSLPALLTGGEATHASEINVNADGTIQLGDGKNGVNADAGTSLISGGIETVGETGGAIAVLGDRVGLLNAVLNASGNSGGGNIRVGGDYQGQGSVFNAERTFVDEASLIAADALTNGDGGQVTLWANDATKFDGNISAQGGAQGGDGGRVEISGLAFLDFQGQVDTSAVQGQVGSLLLDPTNIEVVAAGGTATSLADVDNFLDADLGPGLTTTIDAGLLNSALSNITLQAVNDITFSSDINIAAPDVGLTADAGNNITVNANIRTNGGDVLFRSDLGGIAIAGNIDTSADPAVANRNAGDILLTAENTISTGTLFAEAADGDGGDILVQSDLGDISVAAIATSAREQGRNGTTGTGNAGSVLLRAPAGNITLTNSFGIQAFATTGELVATGNGGDVAIEGGRSVFVGGEIDTRSQAIVSTQGAQVGQGGDIFVSSGENLTIDGRLISLSLSGSGSTVTQPTATTDEAGDITLRSEGDIDLRSGSVLATPQSINAISPVRSGTVVIDAEGDINFVGEDNRTGLGANSIQSGALTFRAGGGISLDLNVDDAEILTNGQDVTFVANDAINLQSVSINTSGATSSGGNVALLSSGDRVFVDDLISTSSSIGAAGNVTVQALSEIQLESIVTASAVDNAGNVFLDPIGDIQVSSIDASAINGLGGTVDVTAGRYFRATDSSVDFNGTVASISTAGALGGGPITLRQGGGGFVPFVLGDAGLNGAQAALTTGNNTVLPPQDFLGPFVQGDIQIVTTPGKEPIPEIEDDAAVLDDLDNLVGKSDNPEISAPPSTVIVTYDDPAEIREAVNSVDTGFNRQHKRHYDRDGEGPDLSSDNDNNGSDNNGGGTNRDTDNDADGDTDSDAVVAGENEPLEEDAIESTQQTIQQIEAATEGVKPAVMYVFFAPGDTFFPAATDLLNLDGNLVGQGEEQAYRSPLQMPEQVAGCEGRENHQLFLVLVTSDAEPVAKQLPGVTCTDVVDKAHEFRKDINNYRSDDYFQSSQELYKWLIAPLSDSLGMDDNAGQLEDLTQTVADPNLEKITNLVFIMDQGLRSLPLAALHDGEKFLIEKDISLGLMPSISLTETGYRSLKNEPILSLGISDFSTIPDNDKKKLDPLPAVPFELENISGHDNDEFNQVTLPEENATISNLQNERQRSSASIVHLATHADFRQEKPTESYIQFWGEDLHLSDVRRMGWGDPAVDLLVLSACETAVDNYEAELGFAGFAHQAGVSSVLASLWQVSDIGTAGLMTEFYTKLRTEPTKSEALRQAQLAMLNKETYLTADALVWSGGERLLPDGLWQDLNRSKDDVPDLSHPFYWSGFTLVGNPW